ncbi:MAG: Gfo/Idh/MocA family oxidoreductase [Lachnospiraceae bacterium]|nr:Gfo/Idh/MocA family oxidoreductase [Lachnospiraceae bacterium]
MKPRIGVFGAYRGMDMIDVFMAYPEAELVAVCDKHIPTLEKVRAKAEQKGLDVALYEKFDDFIEHEMDGVVLANYATEHAPYAIRCLDKGLHVMSEVMASETMAQAVELIEAVERSGKVYTFAENCCYMNFAFEMWQKYQEGDLGDVMYAECEYIHDCVLEWPKLTYGDPNHWRNLEHPNFYSSHSLGPIFMATGRRPVQVVGYEIPRRERNLKEMAMLAGPGLEMVTLDNGAVVKSIHGALPKKSINMWNFQIYCQNGTMETGRYLDQKQFHMYLEGEVTGRGSWKRYDPVIEIARDYAIKSGKMASHAGADFYAPYFFIEKILGKPNGKWAIDVYQAVDMSICGILAWRSVLNGNIPISVPDLRDPAQRDAFRNDHACPTPSVAGDQLVPSTSFPYDPIPQEKYDEIRQIYLEQTGQK